MKRSNIACISCKNEICFIKTNSSEKQLAEIAKNKMMQQYKKHQQVFYEGNISDSVYFIYAGTVKVFKTGAFNRDHVIRLSVVGDILGHRGIISEGVYPVSAQTLEPTVICQFTKEYFLSLLHEIPQLAISLMMFYGNELNYEESKLRDMSLFNVREKVAKALLILIERFGLDDNNAIINANLLTRQDIAECVGISSNQVTKVLADFKQEQLISLTAKNIVILNQDGILDIVAI